MTGIKLNGELALAFCYSFIYTSTPKKREKRKQECNPPARRRKMVAFWLVDLFNHK